MASWINLVPSLCSLFFPLFWVRHLWSASSSLASSGSGRGGGAKAKRGELLRPVWSGCLSHGPPRPSADLMHVCVCVPSGKRPRTPSQACRSESGDWCFHTRLGHEPLLFSGEGWLSAFLILLVKLDMVRVMMVMDKVLIIINIIPIKYTSWC